MKRTGKVLAVFHALKGHEGRVEVDELELDADGIIGDKNYAKRPNRSILITSEEASYGLAKANGISMPFGSLGENIVIDIDPYALSAGAQLKLGEAIVAITQNCTLCSSLSKVDERLPELLKNDRGIFAKTVQGGKIKKGDPVVIL
jgi:MOSC domain-containing protein YiiM